MPLTLEPGTPVLILDKGAAHASVKVDRNGLILLNFTTTTGQNQIALSVIGDSSLELGVFDSFGKVKLGVEVPMKDSGQVHMLLLDKREMNPDVRNSTHS